MAPYSSLTAHRLVSKCSTCNCRGFLFLGTLSSGPASGMPTHHFAHSFCRLLAQHFNLTPCSPTWPCFLVGPSIVSHSLLPFLSSWSLGLSRDHLFSSHHSYLTPCSGQTKGNLDSLSEPICLFFKQWWCYVSIDSCFFFLLGTTSLIIRWAGKRVLVSGIWRKSWLVNKCVPLSNAFSSPALLARFRVHWRMVRLSCGRSRGPWVTLWRRRPCPHKPRAGLCGRPAWDWEVSEK